MAVQRKKAGKVRVIPPTLAEAQTMVMEDLRKRFPHWQVEPEDPVEDAFDACVRVIVPEKDYRKAWNNADLLAEKISDTYDWEIGVFISIA